MWELDPHPDVEPALRTLREAGVPAVTLTNGGVEVVSALLRWAGLRVVLLGRCSGHQCRARSTAVSTPRQEVGGAAGRSSSVPA
ncbi:hypothetical protein [Micromonospora sp. Llam0]|uniref:hypothetical protein n=1 Tax=Micromonospora sp. Llam0 TaxID=2485143 RepID=UPI0018F2B02A|nr:hypothetical protein [Micromonospora sp. Llam0]